VKAKPKFFGKHPQSIYSIRSERDGITFGSKQRGTRTAGEIFSKRPKSDLGSVPVSKKIVTDVRYISGNKKGQTE